MVTFYLILGHLIADFLAQPPSLIKWKHESWKGVASHVGIHFLVSLVLLAPFLPNINVFAALSFVIAAHFIIDESKISLEKYTKNNFVLYLADQLAHLLVLLFAGLLIISTGATLTISPDGILMSALVWLYTNFYVVAGLCLFIIVTFAYELMIFQNRRRKNSRAVYKPNIKRMATRFVIWAVIYGVFLVVRMRFL